MTTIAYDYNNFDPEAGGSPTFPPEGEYNFKVISVKEGETRSGDQKFTIEFLAQGTEATFPLNYNTGHSSAQTRQIAFEQLGRLYFGITGQKPPATGFDLADLINGAFHAGLVVKEKDGYTNADFRNIKPMEGAQAPAPAPQPAQANKSFGKPSWS